MHLNWSRNKSLICFIYHLWSHYLSFSVMPASSPHPSFLYRDYSQVAVKVFTAVFKLCSAEALGSVRQIEIILNCFSHNYEASVLNKRHLPKAQQEYVILSVCFKSHRVCYCMVAGRHQRMLCLNVHNISVTYLMKAPSARSPSHLKEM